MTKNLARKAVAVAAAALPLASLALPTTAFAAASSPFGSDHKTKGNVVGFRGDSYAFGATLGNIANVGPLFESIMGGGCTPLTTASSHSSSLATLTTPVGSASALGSTVSSTVTATARTASADTSLGSVNFPGLLSASAFDSSANISLAGTVSTGKITTSGGASIADLSIPGVNLPVSLKPNTTIAVPHLGTVVLNEQMTSTSGGVATFTVNAVDIKLLSNVSFGSIKAGSEIIVGHSTATLLANPVTESGVSGNAFATQLSVAGVVTSGPSSSIYMGCTGTDGDAVKTAQVASASFAGVSFGALVSTKQGMVGAKTATSTLTDTIGSIGALGLVSASGITAEATATRNADGSVTLSQAGSSLATLKIAGYPALTANVAPNTTLNLGGFGTITLDKVTTSKSSINVRMIEIKLTAPCDGLPAGSDIIVGSATAGIVTVK